MLVLKSTVVAKKQVNAEKKQFKMYLEPYQFDRLNEAAEKHGRSSGQAVAMEILELYLPVWESVEKSVNNAVTKQSKSIANRNFPPTAETAAEPLQLEESENYNEGDKLTRRDKRKTGNGR